MSAVFVMTITLASGDGGCEGVIEKLSDKANWRLPAECCGGQWFFGHRPIRSRSAASSVAAIPALHACDAAVTANVSGISDDAVIANSCALREVIFG